jgi:outer membrane protein OmpA-like peptidoglycan-associated protein
MFLRLLLLSSILVTGCKKAEPEPAAAPPGRQLPARPPMLPAVNFDTGSSAIPGSEEASITRAKEILQTSDWSVVVVGLADATGDAAANKVLSEQRAEAVASRLRQVVPSSRVIVYSVGERLATGGPDFTERKVESVFFHPTGLPIRDVVARSRAIEDAR